MMVQRVLVLVVLALIAVRPGFAGAGHRHQVFINTSADIFDMAYDSQNGMLYMSNAGPYLLRFDVTHSKMVAPLLVGGNLYGIDVSANGKMLAAADGNSGNGIDWIEVVDLGSGRHHKITGAAGPLESGTFDVAFYRNSSVVVSGAYPGSGFEPIQIADVRARTLTSVGNATNATVLRASPDRGTVGFTQGDISNGPWGTVDVPGKAVTALGAVNWFTYDVAVSRGGRHFAVPTYDGTFVFDNKGNGVALLGQYATVWFNGAVFDPTNSDLLYQSLANSNQIELWNVVTQKVQRTITATAGSFPSNGNGTFSYGYMRISPDGKLLFAKVQGGVLLVPLP